MKNMSILIFILFLVGCGEGSNENESDTTKTTLNQKDNTADAFNIPTLSGTANPLNDINNLK